MSITSGDKQERRTNEKKGVQKIDSMVGAINCTTYYASNHAQ